MLYCSTYCSILPSCGGNTISSGFFNVITNGCNISMSGMSGGYAEMNTNIGGCCVCFGGQSQEENQLAFNTDIVGKKNIHFDSNNSILCNTSIGSACMEFHSKNNFALSSCCGYMSGKGNVMIASCNSSISDAYSAVVGLQSCTTSADCTSFLDVLSKVVGSFTIPHPNPAKKNTHTLSHNFVEAPTEGENIYRYQVSTINCQATIELPSYYKFLNKNTITKVSPVDTFGTGYAVLDSAMDCVTFTSNCEGNYNILLIGTRKDPDAIKSWCGVEPYRDSNNCSTGREV